MSRDARHGRKRAYAVLDNEATALTEEELWIKSQEYRDAYLAVLSEYPAPECVVVTDEVFDEEITEQFTRVYFDVARAQSDAVAQEMAEVSDAK